MQQSINLLINYGKEWNKMTIRVPLSKLERGLRTERVKVTRGGKTFYRKQRVGQKEKTTTTETEGWLDVTNVENLDRKINFVKQDFEKAYKEEGDISTAISQVVGEQKDLIDYKIVWQTDNVSDLVDVKGSLMEISTTLSDTLKSLVGRINIQLTDTKRSYFDGDNIHLSSNAKRKETLAHELGHAIEGAKKSVHYACVKFLDRRTKGEESVRMKDLYPGAGYGDDEVTKGDNFIHPYIGSQKKYQQSSEVLSMGCQWICKKETAEMLYKKDKEHFFLTLAIISGRV